MAVFEQAGDVQRLDVGDMREQIEARERRLDPGAHRGRRRRRGRRDEDALRGARRSRRRRRRDPEPLHLRDPRGDPRGVRRGGARASQLAERDPGRAGGREAVREAAPAWSPRCPSRRRWRRWSSSTRSATRPATRSGWSPRWRRSSGAPSRRPRARTRRAGSCAATPSGSRARRSSPGEGRAPRLSATVERLVEGVEIVTVIEGEGAPIPLDQLPLELADGRRAGAPPRRPAALLVAHCCAMTTDKPSLACSATRFLGGSRGRSSAGAAARTIRARVRSGGLLIRTRVPGNRFADYQLTVAVDEPRRGAGSLSRGRAARRLRPRRARIETGAGDVVASRDGPAAGLLRPRGAAPQPALGRPRLGLLRGLCDVELPHHAAAAHPRRRAGERGRSWEEEGESWRRLEVTFPEGLDTHSRRQSFYFDAQGRLRRHDYVAEVVGGWAQGGALLRRAREAGGLWFPTRRWVRPIGPGNRSLPFPTLVWIELSDFRVT